MLKLFNLKARDIKIVEKSVENSTKNTFFMASNQGEILPIVFPLQAEKVCVEGTSCDLYR